MRRDQLLHRLRALTGPAARERLHAAWAALRRRPDTVIATAVVLGVLVMLLHWS